MHQRDDTGGHAESGNRPGDENGDVHAGDYRCLRCHGSRCP
jgi:hypothetical protein